MTNHPVGIVTRTEAEWLGNSLAVLGGGVFMSLDLHEPELARALVPERLQSRASVYLAEWPGYEPGGPGKMHVLDRSMVVMALRAEWLRVHNAALRGARQRDTTVLSVFSELEEPIAHVLVKIGADPADLPSAAEEYDATQSAEWEALPWRCSLGGWDTPAGRVRCTRDARGCKVGARPWMAPEGSRHRTARAALIASGMPDGATLVNIRTTDGVLVGYRA